MQNVKNLITIIKYLYNCIYIENVITVYLYIKYTKSIFKVLENNFTYIFPLFDRHNYATLLLHCMKYFICKLISNILKLKVWNYFYVHLLSVQIWSHERKIFQLSAIYFKILSHLFLYTANMYYQINWQNISATNINVQF